MKRTSAKARHPTPTRPAADAKWRGWLEQAVRAHRHHHLDEAERLYREVLGCEPGQPDALHFLGVLNHQRGHSGEAVEFIEKALKAIPNHPDAHNNLGNIHRECGRPAEAEACYRRALACAPAHADALCNLAMVLEAQERFPEAFAAYGDFLEAAPDNARAWHLMGLFLQRHAQSVEHVEQSVECFRHAFARDNTMLRALQSEGVSLYVLKRHEEARQVYRDWLARDPNNPAARHMLAACGGTATPARADSAYVRASFDGFAASFDRQLLENLEYRAPQVLADALAAVLPPPATGLDILDAGCGTGLSAPLLRAHANRLVGVDLSTGMMEHARRRGGYDELVEAELTDYLQRHPRAFDVVLSADTLVYFGDLAPVFAAAHAALRPGGWLAFSLEAFDGEGFNLSFSGRFQHSRAYVEHSLRAAGFDEVRVSADSLRKEIGQPVASWVVMAATHGPRAVIGGTQAMKQTRDTRP